MLTTAREYYRVAREVGIQNNSWILSAYIQIILARLFCGIAPGDFAAFGLVNRPFSEWSSYLSKRQSDALQAVLNPDSQVNLARDKAIFCQRMAANELRCPMEFGQAGKTISAAKGRVFTDKAILIDFLSGLPKDIALAVKSNEGSYGKALLVLDRFDESNWVGLDGDTYTHQEVAEHCLEKHPDFGGFLLQERIKNHSELSVIAVSGTLMTFRLVTFLPPGAKEPDDVRILFVAAKTPRKGSMADNFGSGKTGHLLHFIDLDTGSFGDGYWRDDGKLDYCLTRAKVHPENGVVFNQVVVPYFEELKETARRGALSLPQLPLLGWDIAIDQKGPVIIEANSRSDPILPQLFLDTGMRPLLNGLIAEYAEYSAPE